MLKYLIKVHPERASARLLAFPPPKGTIPRASAEQVLSPGGRNERGRAVLQWRWLACIDQKKRKRTMRMAWKIPANWLACPIPVCLSDSRDINNYVRYISCSRGLVLGRFWSALEVNISIEFIKAIRVFFIKHYKKSLKIPVITE